MASIPTESILTCPHCSKPIRLTEALAAPLIAAARGEVLAEVERREQAVASQQEDLRKAKAALEQQVEVRLRVEREQIAKSARESATADVALKLQALEAEVREKKGKLAEAQVLELDLRKKARELEEARATLVLENQRTLDAERASVLEKAQKDVEERHRLKDAEKEKVVGDLKQQIEELRRKAEQGSQQLQGEVQELDLEEMLRLAFPRDTIEPVAKGVTGADCVQAVFAPSGARVGSILWESKRTKAWSAGWLAKLRDDQRAAKADFAILVSTVLPKEVPRFGLVEGVWVSDLASSVPLAHSLRGALELVSRERATASGKETKMELLYAYICGPEFRGRAEAIVEAFRAMKDDLDAEKRATTKQWAKREKQIERVLNSTCGMYGDLQGIAGSSIPELPGLSLPEGEVDGDEESEVAEPKLLEGS